MASQASAPIHPVPVIRTPRALYLHVSADWRLVMRVQAEAAVGWHTMSSGCSEDFKIFFFLLIFQPPVPSGSGGAIPGEIDRHGSNERKVRSRRP